MRLSSVALIVASLTLPGEALAAEPVTGRWITDDGKALVTIGHCGNTVCGEIARILAPTPDGPPVDANNPDPNLRKRPILGLRVLSGFTDSGDDWRGQIYSPEEGKSYRSILRRSDGNTIKVKGCILFFCKTQTWKRAG